MSKGKWKVRILNNDVVLDYIGRIPITTPELYQRVLDDFGTVNKRTFYYELGRLVKEGKVIRSIVETDTINQPVYEFRRLRPGETAPQEQVQFPWVRRRGM